MLAEDGTPVVMDLGSATKARVDIKTLREATTLQVGVAFKEWDVDSFVFFSGLFFKRDFDHQTQRPRRDRKRENLHKYIIYLLAIMIACVVRLSPLFQAHVLEVSFSLFYFFNSTVMKIKNAKISWLKMEWCVGGVYWHDRILTSQ